MPMGSVIGDETGSPIYDIPGIPNLTAYIRYHERQPSRRSICSISFEVGL